MSGTLPPPEDGPRDYDPRHIEIMEAWVRKIVGEVAQGIADGIVAEVGRIFLDAKTANYHSAKFTRERLEALELALKAMKR